MPGRAGETEICDFFQLAGITKKKLEEPDSLTEIAVFGPCVDTTATSSRKNGGFSLTKLCQFQNLTELTVIQQRIGPSLGLEQLALKAEIAAKNFLHATNNELGGSEENALSPTIKRRISEHNNPVLPNLSRICLNENLLTEIRGVGVFKGLQQLYLAHNRITQLPTSDWLKLPQLRTLWLMDNRLSHLHGLQNLTKLQDLNVAANQIAKIRNQVEEDLGVLIGFYC